MEKLKIDYEKIQFTLNEDSLLGFLIHYAAPYTGGSECIVPAGTKFMLTGAMRDDACYMRIVESKPDLERIVEDKVKEHAPKLVNRWGGCSFFITEEQMSSLSLRLDGCSVDDALRVFKDYRENNRNFISFHTKLFKYKWEVEKYVETLMPSLNQKEIDDCLHLSEEEWEEYMNSHNSQDAAELILNKYLTKIRS